MRSYKGESFARAIETATPPPGRLERVPSKKVPVFVDFAHTDDALGTDARIRSTHSS